jgi:hypothetical protein
MRRSRWSGRVPQGCLHLGEVFEIASSNLVIELGIILADLAQFTLAECAGGIVMIVAVPAAASGSGSPVCRLTLAPASITAEVTAVRVASRSRQSILEVVGSTSFRKARRTATSVVSRHEAIPSRT